MQIISRQLAIARGDSFYFTGKPCKYNHIEKRRVINRFCYSCENAPEKTEARNKKNVELYYKYRSKRLKSKREYYKSNKEKIAKKDKEYRKKNKEYIKSYQKAYREKNKEKIQKKSKQYYEENKERLKSEKRIYNKLKKKQISEKKKEYSKKRRPQINAYRRNKTKTDPLFNLQQRCRGRIKDVFKKYGYTKGAKKTTEMLGCDWATLKLHIESQFLEGMTWENKHLWHIDHIIPYATAETEADIIRLSHHTNLQPLWAKDNLQKGAKLHYDPTPTRPTK